MVCDKGGGGTRFLQYVSVILGLILIYVFKISAKIRYISLGAKKFHFNLRDYLWVRGGGTRFLQ